jgi:hypothetical protein
LQSDASYNNLEHYATGETTLLSDSILPGLLSARFPYIHKLFFHLQGCVKVTSVSLQATESLIAEFFSFSGDIESVKLFK